MIEKTQRINSIELFCGTGGLALGLHFAGFDHKALYEWDKDSCENIMANVATRNIDIDDWQVFQTDVRAVSYSKYKGLIHLISGGPPCQPFSLGGKAQAHNDKRDMFPEAVRAVREVHPEAFVFENVKGLLRTSFSSYFQYILLQLMYPSISKQEDMTWEEHKERIEQYDLITAGNAKEYRVQYRLVNAADYGVPQSRYRVIIVGFRSDINLDWQYPKPTHSRDELLYSKWISKDYWKKHNLPFPAAISLSASELEQLEKRIKNCPHRLQPWLTTRDAIGDLPDPRTVAAEKFNNHIFRPGARCYAGHTGSSLDEPSKTIKAGAHGVPGGENTVILDNGEVRYYTVRESARIQTFPDKYDFFASWTESMRQIGNAVPTRLAEVIGNSLYQQLKGVSHESKQ